MTESAAAGGALAFVAGLVSVLSPCVLALVPAYLGYLSGPALSERGRARVLARSALFVLGFSTVFVLLGATATAAGRVLWAYRSVVRQAAGALVVLLGLHQVGLVRIGLLERELRPVRRLPGRPAGTAGEAPPPPGPWRRRLAGPWGAFPVGMAFAAGWSPCVGPVLASILLMAGTSQTVGAGMGLLALYAAGMALPFLVMAALLERGAARMVRRVGRHAVWVERASGVLLLLIGVALYTNFFLRLPGYLSYYRWVGL